MFPRHTQQRVSMSPETSISHVCSAYAFKIALKILTAVPMLRTSISENRSPFPFHFLAGFWVNCSLTMVLRLLISARSVRRVDIRLWIVLTMASFSVLVQCSSASVCQRRNLVPFSIIEISSRFVKMTCNLSTKALFNWSDEKTTSSTNYEKERLDEASDGNCFLGQGVGGDIAAVKVS